MVCIHPGSTEPGHRDRGRLYVRKRMQQMHACQKPGVVYIACSPALPRSRMTIAKAGRKQDPGEPTQSISWQTQHLDMYNE